MLPGHLCALSRGEAAGRSGRGATGDPPHHRTESGGVSTSAVEPGVEPAAVLHFWFSDHAKALWFEKDSAFDDDIRRRFGAAVDAAQAGAFEHWRQTPEGTLALLILLD